MALGYRKKTKEALAREGPSKKLGQYFLIDKKAIKRIMAASGVSSDDTVLEVGPGSGALTEELCQKAKKVVAVEKDPKMAKFLKEDLKSYKNLKVYQGDILSFDLEKLKEYKVVANLPFYLTNPVIRMFLEAEKRPKEMTLLVQKELAQRICAKPPKMNLLAVSVQFYAFPKIVSYVKKSSFLPQPKIDTAVLKIIPDKKRRSLEFDSKFFQIIRAGFAQPRKQLANNLAKGLKLNKEEAGRLLLKNSIQPDKRAETLKTEDWISLTKFF
jgi:16S rRNA (adenine1518-N6/adenine1519-N6)-dimethyltransferase